MQRLYGLPSDAEDSEAEADEGTTETSVQCGSQSISDAVVDVPLEPDVGNSVDGAVGSGDSSEEEEDQDSIAESEDGWSSSVSGFCNIPDFDEEPRIESELNSTAGDIEYFNLVFTEDVVNNIVTQTNTYAGQSKTYKNRKLGITCNEPTRNWTETDSKEIRAWIGMTTFMGNGIHQLPDLDSYWSSDPALTVPVASRVMPCKRYKKLQEVLPLLLFHVRLCWRKLFKFLSVKLTSGSNWAATEEKEVLLCKFSTCAKKNEWTDEERWNQLMCLLSKPVRI